jgi:hypothetical protein
MSKYITNLVVLVIVVGGFVSISPAQAAGIEGGKSRHGIIDGGKSRHAPLAQADLPEVTSVVLGEEGGLDQWFLEFSSGETCSVLRPLSVVADGGEPATGTVQAFADERMTIFGLRIVGALKFTDANGRSWDCF